MEELSTTTISLWRKNIKMKVEFKIKKQQRDGNSGVVIRHEKIPEGIVSGVVFLDNYPKSANIIIKCFENEAKNTYNLPFSNHNIEHITPKEYRITFRLLTNAKYFILRK